MDLLTGPALATALYEKGLAPEHLSAYPDGYGGSCWYWHETLAQEWRPWDTIGDVWHLVLRYAIEITPIMDDGMLTGWLVTPRRPDNVNGLVSDGWDALPTLIGNVALWCQAQEEN